MASDRRVSAIVLFSILAALLFLLIRPHPSAEKKAPVPAAAYQQRTYFPQTIQAVTAHFITGQEKGPTLLIVGGIHGDEAAGYLAAERFARIP
ncbi:MAG: hypothetical protein PHS64_08210, partial [Candidatus Omnitrophica bacterium]|nr:hypothetical protein [Candidatus Omnitrophota bacterium]